jgi:hypothetical protein
MERDLDGSLKKEEVDPIIMDEKHSREIIRKA